MEDLKRKIEALLFSSARSMTIEEIKRICRVFKDEPIVKALEDLKIDYDNRDSALNLIQEKDMWKIQTKEHYFNVVKKVVTETELSKTLMETLVKLTDKFFAYFDLPPEKLKDKFSDFTQIANAIQDKEKQIDEMKEEHKKQVEEAKRLQEEDEKQQKDDLAEKEKEVNELGKSVKTGGNLNEGEKLEEENADENVLLTNNREANVIEEAEDKNDPQSTYEKEKVESGSEEVNPESSELSEGKEQQQEAQGKNPQENN
jgi:hypothetical protein